MATAFKASDVNYSLLKNGINPRGAGVVVTDNSAQLVGSKGNAFTSHGTAGNFIHGPLSILAKTEDIRIGGFWKLNPGLESTIASTIVSPNPVLVFNIPGTAAIKPIKDAVVLLGLMLA